MCLYCIRLCAVPASEFCKEGISSSTRVHSVVRISCMHWANAFLAAMKLLSVLAVALVVYAPVSMITGARDRAISPSLRRLSAPPAKFVSPKRSRVSRKTGQFHWRRRCLLFGGGRFSMHRRCALFDSYGCTNVCILDEACAVHPTNAIRKLTTSPSHRPRYIIAPAQTGSDAETNCAIMQFGEHERVARH